MGQDADDMLVVGQVTGGCVGHEVGFITGHAGQNTGRGGGHVILVGVVFVVNLGVVLAVVEAEVVDVTPVVVEVGDVAVEDEVEDFGDEAIVEGEVVVGDEMVVEDVLAVEDVVSVELNVVVRDVLVDFVVGDVGAAVVGVGHVGGNGQEGQ